jgi:hypothetical protein
MATPNYAFEKRQKELAKKAKKAEKLQQKQLEKSPSSDLVLPDSDIPVTEVFPR